MSINKTNYEARIRHDLPGSSQTESAKNILKYTAQNAKISGAAFGGAVGLLAGLGASGLAVHFKQMDGKKPNLALLALGTGSAIVAGGLLGGYINPIMATNEEAKFINMHDIGIQAPRKQRVVFDQGNASIAGNAIAGGLSDLITKY